MNTIRKILGAIWFVLVTIFFIIPLACAIGILLLIDWFIEWITDSSNDKLDRLNTE